MWRKLISFEVVKAPPRADDGPTTEKEQSVVSSQGAGGSAQPSAVSGQRSAEGVGVAPDQLLRRLNWTILRPLARYLGGEERSLVRGPGMELAEIREYQPGDDVRHIDWSITARMDRPYVREANVDRALDAWLLLDISSSIDWGTAQCLKRDRAVEFATIAGQLLGRNGNRVGAMLFADQPLTIVPPGVGRAHLLQLLSKVRETPRQATRGQTDLSGALTRANSIMPRKSLVLVVSDFIVPGGWQQPLGRLAQRHEVVAARLHDPREGELPDIGLVTFEDPETGQQLTVDTGSRKLRERYRQAAQQQAEQIHADLVRCGVDELPISTETDLLPTLVRFLNARKYQRAAIMRRSGVES